MSNKKRGKVIKLPTNSKNEAPKDLDIMEAAESIVELARCGELTGIAYVAMLKDGDVAHGYVGEAASCPDLTMGLLARLSYTIASS